MWSRAYTGNCNRQCTDLINNTERTRGTERDRSRERENERVSAATERGCRASCYFRVFKQDTVAIIEFNGIGMSVVNDWTGPASAPGSRNEFPNKNFFNELLNESKKIGR